MSPAASCTLARTGRKPGCWSASSSPRCQLLFRPRKLRRKDPRNDAGTAELILETRTRDPTVMSNEATFAKSAVSTPEGRRWWLFSACVLVGLTNEVSSAVTNLSLSPMRRDLGASSIVMQIAVTLGKLMLGAFMLAGGVSGDVYGRRRVLVLGALGMVGASLLAAVAQTGGMLLVARALDGLASAAIGPMALALIAGAFIQAEQARVMGSFSGCPGSARRSGHSARVWWCRRRGGFGNG